ncbi:cytochrome C oxidase subunit IV family protein [Litoribacter ruber]|uniref:cytochrome C oxidase subunit IV family protein n=1 Tax=Litoribacter ruber TaxID=702568 RepID=UPI001BDA6640|nr:cytochrome C oxidase subunit IV family protein [Litoribacter ruber]MBT0810368.1 cytochrome C oxidase subunit IV family protein [Litoribacter ruber]
MERTLNMTYLLLIALTLLTAVISTWTLLDGKMLVLVIMGIAAAKYLLVAFDFLEMKKAHFFWKFSIVFVCLLIIGVVGLFAVG